jgi:CRP-like cAMP-binding protein
MEISVDVLSRFYPLEKMRPEHLALLAKECQVRECQRKEVLFNSGDTDNFAYFLLQGDIHGEYPDGKVKDVSGDSVQARYAIGDLQPRRFRASVMSATAQLIVFDRRFLDKVVTWDQITRSPEFKAYDANVDANKWVFRLLQSKALQKLPQGSLERLFLRFEEVGVKQDQVIIREGDDADYFYVIKDGAANVSKRMDSGEATVAYLVRGDSFGEDALMSNNLRNATVTMKKDGRLMRLSKANFQELLKHSVVEWVSPGKASILFRQGSIILDVRMPEEFQDRAIKGAINIPLTTFREDAADLDKSKKYVVYCNSGERSASAAFIMSKLGYDVAALQGGLSAVLKNVEPVKK